MGCSDSKGGLANEEIALRSQEAVLFFHSHSVTANYLALCRYTRNQRLNTPALNEALRKMLVLTNNLGSSSKVDDFYNSFMVESGVYDAKLLKVLCVLLSGGTSGEKAEILFEIYDPLFTLSLDKPALRDMAGDLVTVSTERVAILVTDAQWKETDQAQSNKYVERLLVQRPKAEETLLRIALEGQERVRKTDFVDRLVRDGEAWLSTAGVRKVLNQFHNDRMKVKKHEKASILSKKPSLMKPPQTAPSPKP